MRPTAQKAGRSERVAIRLVDETLSYRHVWRLGRAFEGAVYAMMILISSVGVSSADERTKSSPDSKPDAISAEEKKQQDIAARRLEFIKSSAKEYEFLEGPELKAKWSLIAEPLLRFNNPVSGLQDGCFVVWKSESGRPMAGAQFFLTGDDLWIHEFQSLAPMTFTVNRTGESVWSPNRGGVDVKLVPDSPVPAASAVQRLIQMRQIARRFSVSDEFEGRVQSDELRLLSNPLLRFGTEKSDTLDGGLFAFAHGTDPELLVLLEAIRTSEGFRWHYSLAPMTGYALKASLDDKPIWEVAWRKPPYDSAEPFFILVHSREPSLKAVLDLFKN